MGQSWRRAVDSGVMADPRRRCSEAPPPGLLEGIRLFNAAEYFECHEALEAIWHAEREPIRYLYQGILQIGVGFHHLRNGNFRGATLLLHDGIDKTAYFTPECMGVKTELLCEQARTCLDLLHALGRERIAEFDWTLVPRVHLVGNAIG